MARSFLILVAGVAWAMLPTTAVATDPYSCISDGKRFALDARTWTKRWDRLEIVEVSGKVIARYADGSTLPARRARFFWGAIDTDGNVSRPQKHPIRVNRDGTYSSIVLVQIRYSVPDAQISAPCIQNSGFLITARGCEDVVVPIVSKWPEEIVLSCQSE